MTFFFEVPAQSYPKLDKKPAAAAVKKKVDKATAALTR